MTRYQDNPAHFVGPWRQWNSPHGSPLFVVLGPPILEELRSSPLHTEKSEEFFLSLKKKDQNVESCRQEAIFCDIVLFIVEAKPGGLRRRHFQSDQPWWAAEAHPFLRFIFVRFPISSSF